MTYHHVCNKSTRRVPLVEQELLTLPEYICSSPVSCGLHIARSLVFYVTFWPLCCLFCYLRLLIIFWPLCCLFCYLRILTTFWPLCCLFCYLRILISFWPLCCLFCYLRILITFWPLCCLFCYLLLLISFWPLCCLFCYLRILISFWPLCCLFCYLRILITFWPLCCLFCYLRILISFWPLCYLFCYLRILITFLISSNSSLKNINNHNLLIMLTVWPINNTSYSVRYLKPPLDLRNITENITTTYQVLIVALLLLSYWFIHQIIQNICYETCSII
jgi:hypothetical protein